MKKILLVGDSIRIGYDKYVKLSYEGRAEVFYPNENCRMSSYVIRCLHDWKRDTKCGSDIDLVHWNCGLWDCLIMPDGLYQTPLNQYKENIDRICKMIKLYFPGAISVFATSTPVHDGVCAEVYTRNSKDVELFNAAAVEVVKANGGYIDDLYTVMRNAPQECYSDVTHFYTKLGAETTTTQVTSVINELLGIESKTLDFGQFFKEEKNIIGI